MYIINIFKRENRRSDVDRRKTGGTEFALQERRNSPDRRGQNDRREDIGRRSGMYYRLSDRRKSTVDSIIDIL